MPENDGLDKPFWDATRRGELLVQRCNACGTFQWGPEWICHKCLSFDLDWHKVSGRGRIYSWERPWHPVHPALKGHGPYIVVLVELPDAGNVRMLGNLLGDPKQDVAHRRRRRSGVRTARRRQAAVHPGAVAVGLGSGSSRQTDGSGNVVERVRKLEGLLGEAAIEIGHLVAHVGDYGVPHGGNFLSGRRLEIRQ